MSNSGELDEINETKKRSGRPREEVWEYFEEKGERIKENEVEIINKSAFTYEEAT
ncbi:14320_t:CDS:2 [Entrophospora sp. SA101]|nr:14320_t:CDS:2 [Entrophospora sp. SA101]